MLLLVVVHLGHAFSAEDVLPGELPRLIGNVSMVLSSWHGVTYIKEAVRVAQVCHVVVYKVLKLHVYGRMINRSIGKCWPVCVIRLFPMLATEFR